MKVAAALILVLAVAESSAAQSRFNARPFVVFTGEQMAANTTFDAVMGSPFAPFWGAGGEVIVSERVYFDVTVSRFKKTGERAFLNGGQSFRLGIPLTATITPIEISAGYRFPLGSRLAAYGGGGAGHYGYSEESS